MPHSAVFITSRALFAHSKRSTTEVALKSATVPLRSSRSEMHSMITCATNLIKFVTSLPR
jgi:hypothetical protein